MTPCAWPLSESRASELAGQARVAVRLQCGFLHAHDQFDVEQDALAALVAHLRKGGSIVNPAAWLMRVARNLGAMCCRVSRRAACTVSLSQSEPAQDEDPMEPIEPACRVDGWTVLVQDLAEACHGLSEAEQDAALDLAAAPNQRTTPRLKEKLRKVLIPHRAKQRTGSGAASLARRGGRPMPKRGPDILEAQRVS